MMGRFVILSIIIIILMCFLFINVAADDYSYDYEEEAGIGIGTCVLWGIIGGIVIASIFTALEVKRHKPVEKATHADYYIKYGDAKMTVTEDRYLRSTEVKTKVSSSSTGNNTNNKNNRGTKR
jgi:uncharacterized integral membrane protein